MRRTARQPGRIGASARTGPSRRWSALLTAGLLIVLLGLLARRLGLHERLWPAGQPELAAVRIGPHVFHVEIAADQQRRARGLSKRAELAADRGMMFVYPAERAAEEMTFWMKDCWIDLDIAFISANRRIVAIQTMTVEPLDRPADALARYGPAEPAQFALEVPAGQFARRGVRVGDAVEFPVAVERAIAAAD